MGGFWGISSLMASICLCLRVIVFPAQKVDNMAWLQKQ
jgi:hypothetical protein